MLSAAGQGALGLEIRSGRADMVQALSFLSHQPTWLAVAAERAVSRAMGGSCSMPLAAHAELSGDRLQIRAAWGEPLENAPLVRAQAEGAVRSLPEAEALGDAVARQLRQQGAH